MKKQYLTPEVAEFKVYMESLLESSPGTSEGHGNGTLDYEGGITGTDEEEDDDQPVGSI